MSFQFKKYPSIEDSNQVKFLTKVKEKVPQDVLWDVTEKVHGANFCFITDGKTIQCGKRTVLLGTNESFFNWQKVAKDLTVRILYAYNYIINNIKSDNEIKGVQFFGELFGGYYPHADVPIDPKYKAIQKHIYYAPYQSFYGFDIALIHNNEANQNEYRTWLNPDQVNQVYEAANIFYAKSLFRGTLDECLAYSNEFQTHIPEWLGLHAIENNICEGVVIKPMIPQFFGNGERILIKNKNERFAEKKGTKVAKTPKDVRVIVAFVDAIEAYITDARLYNVISHEGEFDMPKEFSKVMSLFVEDIMSDFEKYNEESYNSLEKSDKKAILKIVSKKALSVVKEHYHI